MKFNVNSLLKDKNVLRIVAILSVFNLLGYLMMQNLDAVAFFVIIGFLATYFSKNMIVVLIIAMVTTNFLVASRSVSKVSMNTVEGMTNPKEGKKDTDVKDEEEADEDDVKPMKKTKSPKVDEVSNVEEQYENLQAMLSPEGIKGMTMETETLQKKQKKSSGNDEKHGTYDEQCNVDDGQNGRYGKYGQHGRGYGSINR